MAIARRLEQGLNFSFVDAINATLPHPVIKLDDSTIANNYAISEQCRQFAGEAPSGNYWVPLQAMARDLTTSGASAIVNAGGVTATIGDVLAPASAIVGAGATILSGLKSGALGLPTIDTAIDATGAAWITEGSAAPQRDPTFASVSLEPKSISVEVIVSRRLMQASAANLEQFIRTSIIRRFMAEIDRAAINGSGTEQPDGMLSNADIELIAAGTNGLAPTWANLVDMEYRVANRTGNMQAPAFVTNPAMVKKLRTTQRAAGLDFILSDKATELLGHSLRSSSQVPSNLTKGTSSGVCSAAIFGDMAELFVGFWGPAAIDLLIDGYSQAPTGKIRLIARAEVGVAVRTPGSFVMVKDFLTA